MQVTTGRDRAGERHWVVGRDGRTCLRCATTVRMVAEVAEDPAGAARGGARRANPVLVPTGDLGLPSGRLAGVTILGVPAQAPPLHGPVVFDQRWCDLTYLHWPVDPADVARWMPPGVRPDVVDGVTHVGLIPFSMRAARVGSRLPVPYLGTFAETNVRLYGVDDTGRHGVVFRSLDCSRALVCLAARAVGVPYVWSRVTVAADGRRRVYRTRRRTGGRSSEIRIEIGDPTEPTDLEIFLTARWGMASSTGRLGGRPVWVPNHHEPWPLHTATLTGFHDDLVAAAGVQPVGPMLRALWSPGVHARFGLPQIGPRR